MVDHRIFDGSNLGLNVGSNLAVDAIAVGLKIDHQTLKVSDLAFEFEPDLVVDK